MNPTYIAIGLALAVAAAVYYKKRKDRKADSADVPAPSPAPIPRVAPHGRLIVDTDFHPRGDQDDVQCYLAQASSWRDLWDVRGIVNSIKDGETSGIPFLKQVQRELQNISPVAYPEYEAYNGGPAVDFYEREIVDAHNLGVPLDVHVWGSVRTLADAVARFDSRREMLGNVTVYWVANFNRVAYPEYRRAWDKLKTRSNLLKGFYRDEQAFFGIMRSGDTQKLVDLHQTMLASPVGALYDKYEIFPGRTYHKRWKAGDLGLYFYALNHGYRDHLFVKDQYGFVADGKRAENMVASDGFRDEMIRVVTENINKV